MKDQDIDEVIDAISIKDWLNVFENEIYYLWAISAWSGIPAFFINDDPFSVAGSTGGPNYGLIAWAILGYGWSYYFFFETWS